MEDKKFLDYAVDLLSDLKYSMENNEEPSIEKKDIEAISWLIEQTKKAEMYQSSLLYIGYGKSKLPADHARAALFDVEQRFAKKFNQ